MISGYPNLTRLSEVFVQKYESYLPTAFDESMSILQKLNKIIQFMNETGLLVNSAVDLIEASIESQNINITDLQTEVLNFRNSITLQQTEFETEVAENLIPDNIGILLDVWFENGKLQTIISDAIYEEIDVRYNGVSQKLADGAISPDDFTGNDHQKITQAIQKAITENRAVKFARWYDVTGLGVMTIDKPATNRRMLYLIGEGGGIRKNDTGYIFTSSLVDQGDIISNRMKYEGTQGNGMCVWDCNKMIRLGSYQDSYIDCDGIFEANGRWLQSIRLVNSTILQGMGWAISARFMFDCSFNDNTVEIRESFMRNYYVDLGATFLRDNMSVRIEDNVIEGLSGKAFSLGACYAVKIMGNYMEYNDGGYVDLSANPNTVSHAGLEVSNNMIELLNTQITNNVPAITWGLCAEDVISNGNTTNGLLHSITRSALGAIISTGDHAPTNKLVSDTTRLMKVSPKLFEYVKTTNANGDIRKSGSLIIQQSIGVVTPSITSGADVIVNVPMPMSIGSPATLEFLVLPQWTANTHQIINYAYGSGFNSVNVKIKNLHTTASTFTIYATANHFSY